MFWDALKGALIDTAIVIPILYLAYLLVSYFSHNNNEKYAKVLHYTNKAGPVIGAFLGCIPQCGFSSVMSQLYSKKIINIVIIIGTNIIYIIITLLTLYGIKKIAIVICKKIILTKYETFSLRKFKKLILIYTPVLFLSQLSF